MKTIEKLAYGVQAEKMVKQNPDLDKNKIETVIDPASIALIISLITEIIKCIKARNETPAQTIETAYKIDSPENGVKRRLLNRTIRRHVGWWKYWWEGDEIRDAVIAQAKNTTPETLEMAYKEV